MKERFGGFETVTFKNLGIPWDQKPAHAKSKLQCNVELYVKFGLADVCLGKVDHTNESTDLKSMFL